jgi:hypothetical protein
MALLSCYHYIPLLLEESGAPSWGDGKASSGREIEPVNSLRIDRSEWQCTDSP